VHDELPPLDEIGRDLLIVPLWRRVLSLIVPFALVPLFFVFAARGWWIAALACPVVLSFVTYGSVSHDLVHRTLRLPHWLNEALLSAMELIAFRSGHAYRFTHLHHHARFPHDDDIEAEAARMPLGRALLDGIAQQPRLWWFALRHATHDRAWIVGEGIAVIVLVAASVMWRLSAIYAGLMIAGTWIFPITTVIIPHDARGTTELTQTRLFRGKVLSLLAVEHLYHLEHHLYPQVPHQNWPVLAKRLDPHFARLGVKPLKLLF
jgi:beta-carotene hydroxylase